MVIILLFHRPQKWNSISQVSICIIFILMITGRNYGVEVSSSGIACIQVSCKSVSWFRSWTGDIQFYRQHCDLICLLLLFFYFFLKASVVHIWENGRKKTRVMWLSVHYLQWSRLRLIMNLDWLQNAASIAARLNSQWKMKIVVFK